MKRHALRLLVVATVLLVAAFVALRLLSAGEGLSSVPRVERPWLLALGIALLALPPVANGLMWRDILCRLDRLQTGLIDGVAVFCAAWPGRYVPSSLPYLAGKIALGLRLGHSRTALAASILYEHAILVSLGAATSSVIIAATLAGGGGPWVLVGAGLAVGTGCMVLSPRLLRVGINFAARLLQRDPIAEDFLLSHKDMVVGGAIALIALFLQGASFSLVLAAFTGLSAAELVAAGAIFNLAAVAGIAVPLVPSGLGVREAVLIGLLQTFVSLEVAAAAALVSRFGGLLVDISVGLVGGAVVALRRPVAAREAEVAPATARYADAA